MKPHCGSPFSFAVFFRFLFLFAVVWCRCFERGRRWRPSIWCRACSSTRRRRASRRSRPAPIRSSTSCATRTRGYPAAASCRPSSTLPNTVTDHVGSRGSCCSNDRLAGPTGRSGLSWTDPRPCTENGTCFSCSNDRPAGPTCDLLWSTSGPGPSWTHPRPCTENVGSFGSCSNDRPTGPTGWSLWLDIWSWSVVDRIGCLDLVLDPKSGNKSGVSNPCLVVIDFHGPLLFHIVF